MDPSPWHPGEVALQTRAGVAEKMAVVGRHVLRDHLIDQHRAFYPLLPFVVLGTVDDQGDPWATLRTGAPGFLHSPDPWTLAVQLPPDQADPAEQGLAEGRALGLLGIDLHSLRRNRLNGRLTGRNAAGFAIEVAQAFGNCPQYIHPRTIRHLAVAPAPAQWATALTPEAAEMIAKADTFFVASHADVPGAGRQVDVSHRGGRPGFVHLGATGALTIPDFAGNRFFNTLGNILVTGKAGLVFVDFARPGSAKTASVAQIDDKDTRY